MTTQKFDLRSVKSFPELKPFVLYELMRKDGARAAFYMYKEADGTVRVVRYTQASVKGHWHTESNRTDYTTVGCYHKEPFRPIAYVASFEGAKKIAETLAAADIHVSSGGDGAEGTKANPKYFGQALGYDVYGYIDHHGNLMIKAGCRDQGFKSMVEHVIEKYNPKQVWDATQVLAKADKWRNQR